MPQRNVREDLCGAADRVFLEKGFHAASVNDLVEDAGVPKGSFYNHFESKEALALEAAKRYVESYEVGALRTAGKPPLERLRVHFAKVIDRTVLRGIEKGCLLGTFASDFAQSNAPVRKFVATALSGWGAAVADCLAEAQDAGELPEHLDTAVLGAYLVDSYEGAVLHAKVSHSRAPLDAFMSTTFGLVLPAPKRRR
ncbi:MAG TPA: TetR family transcriptional regulator C-terminal domain-containing protein [Kofleriaceae bacterium]